MDRLLRGFADELVKLADPASEPIHAEFDLKQALRDVRREVPKAPVEPEVQSTFSRIREKSIPATRDYLRSAVLGTLLTPLAALAGRGIFRAVRNRELRQALGHMKLHERDKNIGRMRTGPVFGREVPLHAQPKSRFPGPTVEPLMTYPALATSAGQGALFGSVLQMIRDRFGHPGDDATPA